MPPSPSYKQTSPKNSPNIFPASQYLQERLVERRARNARPRRSRQSDFGPQTVTARDDDIFLNEGDVVRSNTRRYASPSAPTVITTARTATSEADSQGNQSARSRAPGARQLDEELDRLTKQNFDLKLEIDYRRTHQVKLTAEIERMRTIVERAEQVALEHAELLRINSELVEELEKRDKALQEAVTMICDLEETVNELEEDRQSVAHASTIQADSGYAGTETQELASSNSPEKAQRKKLAPITLASPSATSRRLNKVLASSNPAKARREPSFMFQKDDNTNTLRSVYEDNGKSLRPIKSFHSILSKHASTIDDEDSQNDILNSPRLSNLSESSFPSIYAPATKNLSPAKHAWEPELDSSNAATRGTHNRQDSITRVSQWIERHDAGTTTQHLQSHPSSASDRTASPLPSSRRLDHFQSLNNALTLTSLHNNVDQRPQPFPFTPYTADVSRRSSRTPTSFGGPIFGEPLVPSQSDQASQRMLRGSRSTIVEERSLADAPTARFKQLQVLDAELRANPKQMRSSVELNSTYRSNSEHRKTALRQMQSDLSSSPDDDHLFPIDGTSGYYGYPDGGSIVLGTPSRFSKRDVSSTREGASRTKTAFSQAAPRATSRRKSSSAASGDHHKPVLARSGTSPNMLPTLMTVGVSSRPKTASSGEVASPVSYQSTSSSNRTTTNHRIGSSIISPEPRSPPPRSASTRGRDRIPASPGRPSLTQKTQQIFRRLSGSRGSDHDQLISSSSMQPTMRPILPTLTSTPSSAYVNVVPKEMRRAHGVQATDSPAANTTPLAASPQPQTVVHTPTPTRTRTASEIRHITPNTDTAVEKRGFFGRRGSFKQMTGLERSKTATPSARGRRGSSVRDAITSGKIWSLPVSQDRT